MPSQPLRMLLPLALSCVAFAAAAHAATDLELLQGTWTLAHATRDGKPMPEAERKQITLQLKGHAYVFPSDGKGDAGAHGTFKIDSGKSPRTIDKTAESGPDQGKTALGIYTVSATEQRACFAAPGKPRPTRFESKPGSGWTLDVWRRKP